MEALTLSIDIWKTYIFEILTISFKNLEIFLLVLSSEISLEIKQTLLCLWSPSNEVLTNLCDQVPLLMGILLPMNVFLYLFRKTGCFQDAVNECIKSACTHLHSLPPPLHMQAHLSELCFSSNESSWK